MSLEAKLEILNETMNTLNETIERINKKTEDIVEVLKATTALVDTKNKHSIGEKFTSDDLIAKAAKEKVKSSKKDDDDFEDTKSAKSAKSAKNDNDDNDDGDDDDFEDTKSAKSAKSAKKDDDDDDFEDTKSAKRTRRTKTAAKSTTKPTSFTATKNKLLEDVSGFVKSFDAKTEKNLIEKGVEMITCLQKFFDVETLRDVDEADNRINDAYAAFQIMSKAIIDGYSPVKAYEEFLADLEDGEDNSYKFAI